MNTERRLWLNGACVMYSLDVLRKERLNFDMDFTPAYFEESTLMTTLNLLGHPCLYEPRAVIDHKVNGTMGLEKEKYEPIFWRNWNRYLDRFKHTFENPIFDFGV
jgi:GT2 family glycosyltransferase